MLAVKCKRCGWDWKLGVFLNENYPKTVGFQSCSDATATVCELFSDEAAIEIAEIHSTCIITTSLVETRLGSYMLFSYTIFLWDVAVHQSQSMGFLDKFHGIFSSFIMMSCNGNDLFTSKLPSKLLEFNLFRRQFYKKQSWCLKTWTSLVAEIQVASRPKQYPVDGCFSPSAWLWPALAELDLMKDLNERAADGVLSA